MRSYRLTLRINNGVERVYFVRRVDPQGLPNPFVRGFDLVEQTQNPHPRYRVMLAADGVLNCTCPQWQRHETCKHADCFRVAGLLDADFAALIKARTELLDQATAEIAALKKDLAEVGRELSEALDEVAALDHAVLNVTAELETLKQASQPKRRGRSRKAA